MTDSASEDEMEHGLTPSSTTSYQSLLPSFPNPAPFDASTAKLLAESYCENDSLRRELQEVTRKMEHAKALLIAHISTQIDKEPEITSPPNDNIPDAMVRVIIDLHNRTEAAEAARKKAEDQMDVAQMERDRTLDNWRQILARQSYRNDREAKELAAWSEVASQSSGVPPFPIPTTVPVSWSAPETHSNAIRIPAAHDYHYASHSSDDLIPPEDDDGHIPRHTKRIPRGKQTIVLTGWQGGGVKVAGSSGANKPVKLA